MPDHATAGESVYKGIPVSIGVCHGKVYIMRKAELSIPHYTLSDEQVAQHIERLEKALATTRKQLLGVQGQVCSALGAKDASIFDAHLLVLEDPTLIESVTNAVRDRKINVEAAFHEFAEKYVATLAAIDDPYLRERAADMRDVSNRILNNLLGRHEHELREVHEPCILICEDLPPSELALLDRKAILGFATDVGSKTSHTAIMARSLQIPAIVGLEDASEKLQNGTYVLLDGYNGLIIVNPTDQTLFEYGQLVRRQVGLEEKLRDIQALPAMTICGKRLILSANIEQSGDALAVKSFGAEGVGLFRTEYIFINRSSLPSEEEQYHSYREVAGALKPAPVIIRTIDLGGDKLLTHLKMPVEMNPFLGWRAIRFCLEERAIFRDQLRAILRASAEGNVKIMYPMISCLGEIEQANELLEQCKTELRAEKISFDEKLDIGAMVEIPSAAIAADSLAKKVDFFSLGTNDLIQYSLAVDRLNEKIAHLYDPTHPAIVRLIKMTADAAHHNGIWCGVCGEMAGDPTLTPLLLGLGVDELSAAPPLIPHIKFLIRRLKMCDAIELAEFALKCDSGKEILERSTALAKRVAPSLFETNIRA